MADDTIHQIFAVGLRNAHALENEALSIMNRQLDRLESYPDLAARLRRHVSETQAQAKRLEDILADLGESQSSLKDTAASFMGNMAALGHTMADDEILKNSFADYAFENYEIASYRSLITIAETGGFSAAIPMLQKSLAEEEEMAAWLENHLPAVTQQYLALESAGLKANR
ncbi:ferritin-like domain-containing protein [Aquabacter sp. L1I39]|uniref:ferritin-like domain-containing protein n=1 Tax=Aquabacter sp. L1I39 TaxID=2820278 RepID=UPI001ADD3484|nr:ferritin-like domain-containing protein [Aquabacter sp. L1I39]QTL02659.1 ferritin-like domain-containing protein [Aquabacter sp. L1I39]